MHVVFFEYFASWFVLNDMIWIGNGQEFLSLFFCLHSCEIKEEIKEIKWLIKIKKIKIKNNWRSLLKNEKDQSQKWPLENRLCRLSFYKVRLREMH